MSLAFYAGLTVEEVKPFLKKFTGETKKFYCKGEEHTFTISLGFAEYPVLADDLHSSCGVGYGTL